MYYASTADLPKGVRTALPPHAQDIYKDAFNHAWVEYADPERRRGDESRVETASRVAWAAVEKTYEKDYDGKWRAKTE